MEDRVGTLPESHAKLRHPTLDRPRKPSSAKPPTRQSLSLRARADLASVAPLDPPSNIMEQPATPTASASSGLHNTGAAMPASTATAADPPQTDTTTKKQPKAKKLFWLKRSGKEKDVKQPGGPSKEKVVVDRPGASIVDDGRSVDQRKIGHRKVDKQTGEVAYKQVKSSTLMGAIQMGVRQAVGSVNQKQARDLLLKDFDEVESCHYPSSGSQITPPHRFESFKFYNYAPVAFRYFRQAFGIDTSDFLMSLCDKPLRELSNPGASGSVFYLSHDDVFIIKTVQKGEHKFLRKLLPGYYMNLVQNKRTLLPKFFGLFQYQSSLGRNIRFVVMNNLLPSRLTYYQQYDLKGSTFKRFANERELKKRAPTLKDLDFNDRHEHGLYMDPETYERLSSTIRRDCTVLESFKIMDYSLLVGIHHTALDSDVAPPSKDSHEADLYSAHQRSIQKGQKLSDLTTRCLFHEDVGKQPISIQGARSEFHPLNGFYDLQTGDGGPYDGRRCYKLRSSIQETSWVQKHRSDTLYIFYDRAEQRWSVAPAPGSADVVAFVKGDTVSPEFNLGPWCVVEDEGKVTEETSMHAALLRQRTTTSLAPDPSNRFNLSMQDQLDTSDEEESGSRSPVPAVENPHGGLVAYTENGDKVVIFIGIIDILQSYAAKKKLEHTFKAVMHDGDTVSVHKPGFYSKRFQNYMLDRVFQPMQTSASEREVGRSSSAKHRLSFRRSKYQKPQQKPAGNAASARPVHPPPHRSPSLVRRDLALSWGRKDSDDDSEAGAVAAAAAAAPGQGQHAGVTINVSTPPPQTLGALQEHEEDDADTESSASSAHRLAGSGSPRVVMVNSLRMDDSEADSDESQGEEDDRSSEAGLAEPSQFQFDHATIQMVASTPSRIAGGVDPNDVDLGLGAGSEEFDRRQSGSSLVSDLEGVPDPDEDIMV